MKLFSLQYLIDNGYVLPIEHYNLIMYYARSVYALKYNGGHIVRYVQRFHDDEEIYEVHCEKRTTTIRCQMDSEVFELYGLIPLL